MALQEIILTMGRFGSTPLRFAFVAACAVLLTVGASGRTPSAFSDSDLGMLDTRVGSAWATQPLASIDSRTGSWAVSNPRGINTTPMGSLFIIR